MLEIMKSCSLSLFPLPSVLRFWPNTWIFVPSRDREVPHNFMTATLECSSFRNKTKYDDLQDSLCRSTRTKSCEMSY